MKKYLSTGFMILLPFALTLWIISYLYDLFTAPLYTLTETIVVWGENKFQFDLSHHLRWVQTISRLLAFIVTFLVILILGFLGRKFFFKSLLSLTGKILQKIPIAGTIYRLTKDVTQAMIGTNQKTFQSTVIIPFPSSETYSIGFAMGETPKVIQDAVPEAKLSVFVPTAPHPISGYLLFAKQGEAHSIAISTEESFKFLLSCGVIAPGEKKSDSLPSSPG